MTRSLMDLESLYFLAKLPRHSALYVMISHLFPLKYLSSLLLLRLCRWLSFVSRRTPLKEKRVSHMRGREKQENQRFFSVFCWETNRKVPPFAENLIYFLPLFSRKVATSNNTAACNFFLFAGKQWFFSRLFYVII